MNGKPMNHFEEFCTLVRSQTWMSEEFGTILINRLNAAMRDAFARGEQSGKEIAGKNAVGQGGQ